ncbi:MAG: MFS transporter [Candidatus Binatus sp.]|uniref:MFS transporter n=1 Tax=Candidatus Binatus sp. TaxID=2811406 RepID=UPI003C744402
MDSADAKIAGGGSPTAAHAHEPLTLKIKLLYGAPSFAGAAMIIPIFINMPKFYADVVLVPLGYLAMAIAVARSLDALSDPLMGWISDHTHTRLGRRRPYMLIGAPLCGVAFFCLLNPPASFTGGRAAIWFGITFILYFIFHTVYVLPHYALGPELTQDYNERSTLFAWRESFTILGTIVAAAAPGIMMQVGHLTERQAYFRLGIFFSVILTVLYTLLVLNIKERPDFVARESNPLVPGVRRALRNRPFGILLGSYVVGSIAGAIPATMMPFFNAYVIRPANPTFWLSMLLLGYFGFGFISMPIWVWIARRVGKLNAWLASFFLGISGGAAMFLLGPGDVWYLLVLICWAGIGFGAGLFLTPSMQADVIDYDELYTGKRREAQYTAFWSMLPKFVAIPSAAVPIAILASLGYIPNAIQAPRVVFAIRAIFALGPATCSVLSFLIARRFPITETILNQILDGIKLHERAEAAVDPLTGAIVPPPTPGHDEDVGWFLDYFSSGELKRYLAKGASQPVRDVLTAAAASIGVTILSVIYVLHKVSSLSTDPGAMISLIVVAGGLALAIFAFHLMRLGPARRLAAGEVPADVVRAHLGQVVEALQTGTPSPAVATGVVNPS